MEQFFRVIKKTGELLPLEEDLKTIDFDVVSDGVDKNNKPLFRLRKGSFKVGVIVCANPELKSAVQAAIERAKV